MRRWLERCLDESRPIATAGVIHSGFLRIVTHPGAYGRPSKVEDAVKFLRVLCEYPHHVLLDARPAQLERFYGLCLARNARGNTIPDLWIASLALDRGYELVSADRDFGRIPGLRWVNPLR